MYLKKMALALPALMLSVGMAQATPRTAFVHLFEWQWNDIAAECENVLGPAGFAAVQVSPPQKSIGGNQWWTRYQPVSYSIEGRSGDRGAFQNMVNRCKAVGVDIYVDAVINHMAAWDRNFPEVPYGYNDFHNCTHDINYYDRWQIQNCDLSGLNDLKTESDYVRNKIAGYMNDLIGMGVAGFRIDAAKHIPSDDINAIKSRLNGNPYIYQEVIGAGGEPVTVGEYTWVGDVTEFNYTNSIGHYFKGRGPLKELANIGGGWSGWLNSDNAVVFVANHDNQRQKTNDTVTHKDGNNINNLAHAWMMAWPYGYPKAMSSYDWNNHDQGPPWSGASACNNGWLCEHRSRYVKNMVGFRNATADQFRVTNYWDNGNSQMAFGRGGLGFFVINKEGGSLNRSFQTGMPEGTYCDVIHGDLTSNGNCTGPTVYVDHNGNAQINVNGMDAVAFYGQAEPCTGSDCGCTDPNGCEPTGCNNDSMNLRGTFNSWGSTAMTCNDSTGEWKATVDFTSGSNMRFKFDVAGDWVTNFGDNQSDGIAEQGGDDIQISNTGSYTIVFNDSTMQYSVTPSSGEEEDPTSVEVTFTCNNGATYMDQSVYAVGNIAALGNWEPANAVLLGSGNYPTWQGTITVPKQSGIKWKCIKREEGNPSAGLEWQGGNDNSLNSSTSTSTTGSF